MKSNLNRYLTRLISQGSTFGVSGLLLLLGTLCSWSQITITSNPADGATGVSGSAPVVFTFSAAMNTTTTSAFFQSPPSSFYPVTSVWSVGNTVLTCTPMSPFPANTTISWTAAGVDASSMNFANASGSFTTGTGGGGGGGGSGTNATTSFVVGKLYFYEQTNSSAPVPAFRDFGGAYNFVADVGLQSNRTATAVTVKSPVASSPSPLTQNPIAHENYFFFDYSNATPASFEAAYPEGDYAFNVTGTPANLQATVTLPTTMPQPNAPHITVFGAAQSADPTQAFTVKWDPFTNGTSADIITLEVSDPLGKTVFSTPGPGTNGALTGTALSTNIPPNRLALNATNSAQLVFYHFVVTSNANYVTLGYRATGTMFDIITTSGGTVGPTPVVSNPVWGPNGIGFDVATAANQPLKVRFSTDCSLPIAQWQTVLMTNSPGSSVHITLPAQGGAAGFFRLQNGP